MKYRRIIVNRKRQLELVEDDLPTPGPGHVRLRMLAAGVSLPDVMMREGIHPEARRPPFTPGWDVVGTVDARGEGSRPCRWGPRWRSRTWSSATSPVTGWCSSPRLDTP
jgi:NADPH:quinone reductase-like Zn-dependent oxidoreductase